ncbi:hypothetical protein PRZ48_000083 [Zasmidium cellare]|uniref:Amidase domain-containing protein n=1 Tax=Zasmidium cellare TaxID=395010 RepID=A0ABR0EZ41_ZASCE|nr:hypothetical protein PRZ48_000083 [Zasmidium cellare]
MLKLYGMLCEHSTQGTCIRGENFHPGPPWKHPVRFGIPDTEALQSLSPVYASLFNDTIADLQEIPGFEKSDYDYSSFEKANQMLYDSSIVAQRLLAFRPYMSSRGMELLHPTIRATFETAEANAFDAVRAYEDIFYLAQHKRDTEEQFKKIDILVVPATVCHWTASELAEDPIGRNKVMGKFTNFVNLLDLCGISVPTRTWRSVNGNTMSFGVTIIGQAGKDTEMMEMGRKIMSLASLTQDG